VDVGLGPPVAAAGLLAVVDRHLPDVPATIDGLPLVVHNLRGIGQATNLILEFVAIQSGW
jgi:hypothetical protein